MKNKIKVAQITDLTGGDPVAAQVEGVELVVVSCNDAITVFEGRCPHQGTLLSEGRVEDGLLVCRSHGWQFECASGKKANDTNVCLKQFETTVENGSVWVDRSEVLAWRNNDLNGSAVPAKPRTIRDLPGPRGLPILGNSLQVDLDKLHLSLEEWSRIYGPVYRFSVGGNPFIVVADPEIANQVLRNRPDAFRRLGSIEPVLDEIGANGVFSAEGDNWRRQRHLVMQALDTRHLRQFFPTLVKVTGRLKKRWQGRANGYPAVEVQKDLMRFTVDVTTNLAFGYDMNTLEKEGDVIQQHLEKILPIVNSRIYALFPYWRYFRLPADRSLDASLVEIKATVEDFIAHSRSQMEQNQDLVQNPTNFLEGMLAARDEADSKFTDEEIFSNAVTILLAGEDTTANTIAWMMHFMMKYPEVQCKMQAEADEVLGNAAMLLEYDSARKLHYIEAVAHETMRFKPVAPLLAMDANTDLEIGGVQIPQGTSVMLLTRPAALREDEFSEPDKFQPERWLNKQTAENPLHRKSFIPFGSGPRLCPGRSLALLEIKTAMAMVCKNFSLTPANQAEPVYEQLAFTMMPVNLYANFDLRQSN